MIQDEPTVTCVWDAAIVFSRYVLRHHEVLYPNSPNLTQPPRVIELGAGTGLAGLTCAWLGAQVTLTELGDCLPVLQRNVESFITQHPSCASRVEACEYYWGSTLGGTGSADDTEAFSSPTPSVTPALLQQRLASGGYDLVIGTDVIYEVQHFDALLRALLDLTQRRWNPRGAKVVLAYQHRWAGLGGRQEGERDEGAGEGRPWCGPCLSHLFCPRAHPLSSLLYSRIFDA